MAIADITKPMALDETLQGTNTALGNLNTTNGSLAKDASLNTTETTPRNIADVLADELGRITNLLKPDADDVDYDNTSSGLTATNVQDAINEVVDTLDDKADKVSSATNGNLAGLNGSGNLTDSGWNGAKDTTSISGNPISISGLKSNQLAVNPIITLEPIQAGSGTPSPTNIRAISGYDTIEVLSANGSDPTAQGYVKTTDLSESLGQTVYGGTLDVRTGKLTVDRKKIDLANQTWQSYAGMYYINMTDSIPSQGEGRIIAERYKTQIDNTDDNTIYINRQKILFVKCSGETPQGIAVYELATPIEIQLTPHEISLLKDYAYVSTNGTSIALDYHNGELASLADVSQLGETVNELGDSLNRFPIVERIYRKETFTSSTSLAYTGVSITIPNNGCYCFDIQAMYNNSVPMEIAVVDSSSNMAAYNTYVYSNNNTHITIGGRASDNNFTLYIWAKYNAVAQNDININGWIM